MAVRFSVETRGVTRTFLFRKDVVTVGRSKNCTVPIDDPALSRTHCQLEVEDGSCLLRDLNSRNGTELNGERISRADVEPGDEIVIGKTTITFLGRDEPEAVDGGTTRRLTEKLFDGTPRGLSRTRNRSSSADDEHAAARLRRVLDINQKLASELEPERVLPMILDEAVDLARAERGFLLVTGDEGFSVPVARDFWQKDIPEPTYEFSQSIASEVVRRGEPVVTEDASEDTRFRSVVSVLNLKIRSVLCVPLRVRGEALGAIYLDNRATRGTFSEADTDMVQAFADQAALSLLNSDRFARVRDSETRWKRTAQGHEHDLARVRAEVAQLERSGGFRHRYDEIIGRSQAMLECLRLLDRVVDHDLPVLIVGESGTGKELLARALHEKGPRASRPFIVVDCASLPAGLVESELFGHARGAFSGSVGAREGLVESADGGVLFLDEVGEMAPEVQTSLLRVLETGEVRRLGESQPRAVDVRLLASTRHDLPTLIREGKFREDLYYRLKGVIVDVPPLRDRIDDIAPIIEFFLGQDDAAVTISPHALRDLRAYSWPGNVRELHHEIRRLALLGNGTVTPRDLPPYVTRRSKTVDHDFEMRSQVERLERDLILRAIRHYRGNKTKTAQALGLSRLGLRKKMERYGMEAPKGER